MSNLYDTSHYSWTSWVSYRSLEDELINNMRYIPPTDQNMQTWSPQLANLLIIICTRLDSFFKASLRSNIWKIVEPEISSFPKIEHEKIKNKEANRNRLYILDYLNFFDSIFDLKSYDVYFKPHDLAVLSPFNDYQKDVTPSWWQIYNKVKHDYYGNMSLACLDCVIKAFAAYFIIYLIYPESFATLAYNKGVLKTGIHFPAFILSNKRSKNLIQKIEELEQNNPIDPDILKLKKQLTLWKRTIPPYPDFGRDAKILAESSLFVFFYRTEAYNWLKEKTEITPETLMYFPNYDPSPI